MITLNGPWIMAIAMAAHLVVFKALTLPRRHRLLFLAWPGMDPRPFEAARAPDLDGIRLLGRGTATMAVGIVLLAVPCDNPLARAWLAMAAAIAFIHLGLFDAMAGILRWNGLRVERICPEPWLARSLGEFWSVRWNHAFHVFARDRVYLPIARRLGRTPGLAAAFLFSGLVHELVISLPARGGWGLPTLYFAIHGVLVELERRRILRPRRWTTVLFVLLPLPILFHGAFVANVVLPLLGL